jgi:hypothetical protein
VDRLLKPEKMIHARHTKQHESLTVLAKEIETTAEAASSFRLTYDREFRIDSCDARSCIEARTDDPRNTRNNTKADNGQLEIGNRQSINAPLSSKARSLQALRPLDQLRQRSFPDELPEADQKDSSLLPTQRRPATLHIQNHEAQPAYDE